MADTNKKYYVSKEKLAFYDEKIKGYIKDADDAILDSAKKYAEDLGVNYDTAGAAATAESNAKIYTDAEVAKANGAAATAQGAAEAAAAAAATADGKAVDAQGTADGAVAAIGELADYVGDIPTDEAYAEIETVIGYVNKKAEETLAAAQGGSSETAASVKQALDTYKTENNAKVNKNAEDIATAQAAADEAMAHSEGVASDLAEAIEALEGVDAEQEERIVALEGQITGLSGAMHFKGIITGEALPESTIGYENGDVVIFGDKEYVVNNGVFVEFGDVSAEGERLSDLEGRADSAEGKISTIEGEIPAIKENINKKVDQTTYDAKIAELAGADTGLGNRIKTLEDKFGGAEGSVEDQIVDAKQEAIDTAAADATNKASGAETAAKGYADTLNTAMNTRVEALEAIDHEHSNKAELDLIASGDKAKWDAAAGIAHEHGNKAELDLIASGDKAKWDAAEGNAKAYTDAEVLKDRARLDTLETWHDNFTEISEDDITSLFTK